ncbi:hypothetical protein EVAR_46704_1 [Eumeta japonica]|uniref:Uncharacterized protein n=1 Tax=Eumeta variegata TaxID=151549 RepID=A0A4C1X9Q0_EUMVA|nr:hypothetical protein EVAR_46704_1 [Eumeta japonica]
MLQREAGSRGGFHNRPAPGRRGRCGRAWCDSSKFAQLRASPPFVFVCIGRTTPDSEVVRLLCLVELTLKTTPYRQIDSFFSMQTLSSICHEIKKESIKSGAIVHFNAGQVPPLHDLLDADVLYY